jgi:hypothetical protein
MVSNKLSPALLNRLKEELKSQSIPLDNVEELTEAYFKHFKDRIQSLDKLEYRFLNLGTIGTKSSKLEKEMTKIQSSKSKLEKEALDNNKPNSYLIHIYKHNLIDLQKLIEVRDKIKKGKTIKKYGKEKIP